MAKEQRGLGRGLGALLGDMPDVSSLRKPVEYVNKEVASVPEPAEPVREQADVMRIPADKIDPNPYQPRSSFDEESLRELSASIGALGLIQPVTVRRNGDRYQLISGERRFKASRMAGLDLIPAYVREADDTALLEMAIVENVQREDLDPIEIALGFQRLMVECSLTQEQMAARLGKKRASIANYLRLLRLPARVQHDLKTGSLSVGHAKVLLGLEDPLLQEKLCDLVLAKGLSVRQLEDRVRSLTSAANRPLVRVQSLPEPYYRVMGHIGRFFSNDVSVRRYDSGKGTMTIHFNSDAEIEAFLTALEGIRENEE